MNVEYESSFSVGGRVARGASGHHHTVDPLSADPPGALLVDNATDTGYQSGTVNNCRSVADANGVARVSRARPSTLWTPAPVAVRFSILRA
jgi:hypothetical protein